MSEPMPAHLVAGLDLSGVSAALTGGAPLMVDRDRPAMQGVGGAAILLRRGIDYAPSPCLGAAVITEWRRNDHTPLGFARPVLFLVSAIRMPDAALSRCSHVIGVHPLNPNGSDIENVAAVLRNEANNDTILAPHGVVLYAEMALEGDEHAHALVIAATVAMTSGQLRVPSGPTERADAEVRWTSTLIRASSRWLRARHGAVPSWYKLLHVKVDPLPDPAE